MAQEFEKRPDGMPLWKDVSGKNVSCTEKVKVLDELPRAAGIGFRGAR